MSLEKKIKELREKSLLPNVSLRHHFPISVIETQRLVIVQLMKEVIAQLA
jgi:hypothetical protein